MLLNPDMMKWKLTGPTGVKFFYASEEHLIKAVTEGGSSYMKMACYAISPKGRFIKNRSAGDQFPNLLLEMGRDKVNEFFDFMETV
ncbi:hypothetical protein phiPsa397_149 [Pseudomonas phage phiPsa397]|uniref:Uncharacterized protein n=1 Tax=Pseudomonas phage phiPsa397 TaxID=1460367 RepID=A0A7G9V3H9_9CAUD|nr:hypothetical protein QGX16_gp076 [Pseudomonas phage phiPsa397]QNO00835.1 hypothetical protein phiPsa397_149 [Pseudomonas phage phiPsa397]